MHFEDGRDAPITWFHSELDDLDLSVYEYRIYGRIARRAGQRGKCFESVENMADSCGMGHHKVREALRKLRERRMIKAAYRPGTTTVYRLAPRSEWNTEPLPDQEPLPDEEGLPLPDEEGAPLPDQEGEVYPSEGNPSEGRKPKTPLTPDLTGSSSGEADQQAGGLPFHADPESIPDQPDVKRQDLVDVKVPLSEDERELYAEEIRRIAGLATEGAIEHLYQLTFGERGPGRGKAMPRGTEWSVLADLKRTYPWSWLVCGFVIASAKRASVPTVERFIQPWLDKLSTPPTNSDPDRLPYTTPKQREASRLPDPPTGSYDASEREWMDEDYGFEDRHWNEHQTNQGKRWTLNQQGWDHKEAAIQKRLKRNSTGKARSAGAR